MVREFYYDGTTQSPPYPPDTTVFLYYSTTPGRPRIAGEIRLRVASSDDYASFESGFDLLRSDGEPWSLSLYNVSKYHIPLYQKLREDGLVPDDLDTILSSFTRMTKRQSIYTLNDTFVVDFSSRYMFLSVISEQGVEKSGLISAFEERRLKRALPYTGACAYINYPLD